MTLNNTKREISLRKQTVAALVMEQTAKINSHHLLSLAAAKRAIELCPLPQLPGSDAGLDAWISTVSPPIPVPEPLSVKPYADWATAEAAKAESPAEKTAYLGFSAYCQKMEVLCKRRRSCVPREYVRAVGIELIRFQNARYPLDLASTLAEWESVLGTVQNSTSEIRALGARA